MIKLSDKVSRIILAVIIVLSLAVSIVFMNVKQGYHEDELFTYNLANSSKQLKIDGGWNTPEDFTDYLMPYEHGFDYAQVYKNQNIDAVHPPFYYDVLHTVCSIFPDSFSPVFAFSINIAAMAGTLIFLFLIAKRITSDNFYSLIASGAYAISIACFTTTIYIRMYAMLTFFVASFVYLILRLYDKKGTVNIKDCLVLTADVALGVLTQYYFAFFAGLVGIVFLVFKIKEKNIRDFFFVLGSCLVAGGIALAIYPQTISDVFGSNRGLGSLNVDIDAITLVTYVGYKLLTYAEIVAKELFLGQAWLFALCTVGAAALWIYLRFVKKRKIPRKAMFIVFPPLAFFLFIALISPFNSDRYVMPSLPFIAMIYAFAFIRAGELIKNEKLRLAVPAAMLLASVLALCVVRPYYIYGKSNLYNIRDKYCVLVSAGMREWNKNIDKFMQYDGTLIVQTPNLDPNLGADLDVFATKRGVVTNGKLKALADSYINNAAKDGLKDSMDVLKTDEKLASLDSVTVYISRLSDTKSVIDYIVKNTKFKSYELIQSDYSFEDYYNWYDYFAETESYCNVYSFTAA